MLLPGFVPYADRYGSDHTVTGTVLVRPELPLPATGVRRDLLLYLPPTLAAALRRSEPPARRWSLLLMHDGQNVFDDRTSFAGEWCADEALEALAADGIEAVVAAIPSGDGQPHGDRLECYSPVVGTAPGLEGRGGRGLAYLDDLADEVRPLLAGLLPLEPGAAGCGLAGSSMGGVITLCGLVARPDAFGWGAAFSPSFGFSEALLPWIEARLPPAPRPRLHLDVGTAEVGDAAANDAYRARVEAARVLLEHHGAALRWRLEVGDRHHESAWARRFPAALRWLLTGGDPGVD